MKLESVLSRMALLLALLALLGPMTSADVKSPGKYSHDDIGYYLARWEFWVGDELILAGKSAGKTVIPSGEDGIWDGHGVVLVANGDSDALKGRRTYETGTVIMPADPEIPATGSGMFVVY